MLTVLIHLWQKLFPPPHPMLCKHKWGKGVTLPSGGFEVRCTKCDASYIMPEGP
jgi:hypothetical protein